LREDGQGGQLKEFEILCAIKLNPKKIQKFTLNSRIEKKLQLLMVRNVLGKGRFCLELSVAVATLVVQDLRVLLHGLQFRFAASLFVLLQMAGPLEVLAAALANIWRSCVGPNVAAMVGLVREREFAVFTSVRLLSCNSKSY
jgi:hypothetical protein